MASLYVHIPFCHSKCIYCDFYSVVAPRLMEKVVEGLLCEFGARKDETGGHGFETVYFGGGTPSSLPLDLQRRLFRALPLADAAEVTIEANPEDIDGPTARFWLSQGINRVSLGLQTFSDPVLRRIGRRHSAADAVRAVELLRETGFDNISIDLIYGLPGVDFDTWKSDLARALSLPITHLSAYSLTFTEGTMLWKLLQRGKVEPISDDDTERRFLILREMTSDAGFDHYEISNFARPGYRSRHNSGYWTPGHPWIGIGPSAHSFDGTTRRIDLAGTDRWLAALPAPFFIEEETELDRINDTLVASLRTLDGLYLSALPPRYAAELLRRARPFLDSGALLLRPAPASEAAAPYSESATPPAEATASSDGSQRLSLAISPAEWLRSDYFIRSLLLD